MASTLDNHITLVRMRNLESTSWVAGIIAAILAVLSFAWGVFVYIKPSEAPATPATNNSVTNGNGNTLIQNSNIYIEKKRQDEYSTSFVTLENNRYGFRSDFPSHWARRDPHNGDGFGFINPDNKDVLISSSAGFNVFAKQKNKASYFDDDIEDYKIFLLESIRENNGKIVGEIANGMIGEKKSKGKIENIPLPGWRIEYTIEKERKTYHVTHVFSAFNDGNLDLVFNIVCESPQNIYKEYANICARVISSFRILFPWER